MTSKSILDPKFRYVPAHETDIRRRFDETFPGWNIKPKEQKKGKEKVVQLERKKGV